MKYLLTFLILITYADVSAQEFDPVDYSYNYEGIKTNMTKQQIFSHIRVSLAEIYNSYKEVVELEDTLSGVLLLRPVYRVMVGQGGSLQKMEGVVKYKVKVVVKDGEYSIKISDFIHESFERGAANASGGNIANEKPSCGWARLSKKGWAQIKEQARSESTLVILKINRSIIRA